MKKPIIEEIYSSNRVYDKATFGNKAYWEKMYDAFIMRDQLTKDFTAEQNELMKKYETVRMDVEAETALSIFVDGFNMGMQFDIEALGK